MSGEMKNSTDANVFDAVRPQMVHNRSEPAPMSQFEQISTIFDSLQAIVYVADMETHELLFVNSYYADHFGDGIVGRPCYLTLQAGQTGPCRFCTNHLLVRHGVPTPPYIWEFQNTINGRWYQCIDRALTWTDGRLVRMETAMDITGRKAAEEALKQSLDKLGTVLDGTIKAMAQLVESRDPYTAGHQRRVAELGGAIAGEMDLGATQIEIVRVAATLHDIGKICVPAEILNKPCRLNVMEHGLIKTHPRVGYDVLKSIDFPWPVAQIVCQHHERIDGSGYPFQLKGQDLLLEARILAVADVVEAMASHRPYRPTLGIERALEEVSTNRSTLYDPTVVEACLEVFRGGAFKWDNHLSPN